MIQIMGKKIIVITIVILVFCLCLIYYYYSDEIPNYPKSLYSNNEKRFYKCITAYDLTIANPQNRQHIANHFDLVFIPYEMSEYASKIKELNTDIKIYVYLAASAIQDYDVYWDEVNVHDDWFLHDTFGNRIKQSDYGWYAMDVGKQGWQEFYANQAMHLLETYPSLDGVMADEAMQYFYSYEDFWTISNNYIPNSIKDRWHDDMAEFLQHFCSVIDKPILPNTQGIEYAEITGGIIWEGFLHAPWDELDDPGYNEDEALGQIHDLAELTGQGYYYCAVSNAKISDNPTSDEIEQAHELMQYCFCGFLLGVNGPNAVFGWGEIDANDNSKGYYPEMDTEIGNPKTDYYHVEGSLYGRDFENASIFVNFSDDNKSYSITIEGVEYSIKAKTGIIVFID